MLLTKINQIVTLKNQTTSQAKLKLESKINPPKPYFLRWIVWKEQLRKIYNYPHQH